MLRLLPLTLLLACTGGDNKISSFDAEPTAAITSPPTGSSVDEGALVTLEGLAQDNETDAPALTVRWSSNIDGVLQEGSAPASDGKTSVATSALSVGNQVITLDVWDEAGQQATESITLVVVDVPDAPTLEIVHPSSGERARDDEAFSLVVTVGDAQDAATQLVVAVTSDVSGAVCTMTPDSTGKASCDATLLAGDHSLTFTVTDTSGLSTTDTYVLVVQSHEDIDDDLDGWTERQGDCDDADIAVNPRAEEVYNTLDDDCNGIVDDHTTGYDDDGDGQTELDGDCDDDDDTVFVGATQAWDGADNDCDGITDEGTAAYDDDGDGYTELAGDCDDTHGTVYPLGAELEDGLDNDCDGIIDEGTAAYDDDGDGVSENDGDCDDTSLTVYPGAPEIYTDAIDQDCDGIAQIDLDGDGFVSADTAGDDCDDTDAFTFPGAGENEADPDLCTTDVDGDGYGDIAPLDGVAVGSDCDDGAVTVHPDAAEDTADTVDQDCDGVAQRDADGDGYISTATGGDDCADSNFYAHPYAATNEADPSRCYTDEDGDGWGDDSVSRGLPAGEDCDDGDAAISPDELEVCDGADNNCDGDTDEEDADGCDLYFYDRDGDGFGSDSVSGSCLCEPDGYYTSSYDTDCYDNNASANTGATTYKTSSRGDGSYDWNCDGKENKYWKDAGAECSGVIVCTSSNGWTASTAASCGSSGSYQTGCEAVYDFSSLGTCRATTSTYTQKCL